MIHESMTDTEHARGLRLGVRGWRHAHWMHSYYPDDLPEDWQLSYYANEFSSVLVPASYFVEAHDVAQWLEDVPDSFRFYFELPADPAALNSFSQDCDIAGHQLAGIILSDTRALPVELPLYTPQNLWRPGQALTSDVALLAINEADLKTQRQWLQSFAGQCKGNCSAVLVSDERPDMGKLRQLRTLIELLGL